PRDMLGNSAIAYSVMDPAAFAQDGGPSIAERMHDQGVTFRPADNARVARSGRMGGWDMVRERLRGAERPMIYFFANCVDTIRTLPVMQHDTKKPEDIQTNSEDHAVDETRYGCMSRPWVRSSPQAEKPKVLSVDPAQCTVTLQDVF